MKKLIALVLAAGVLMPAVAFAGASTDAASAAPGCRAGARLLCAGPGGDLPG